MGSGGVSPRPPPSGPSGYWMINVCWLIASQAAAVPVLRGWMVVVGGGAIVLKNKCE